MFFLVPRHHPHLSPGLLESTLLYPIRNTKQMINLQACLQKHWRIRKQLEQKPIQHKKSSWHHQVQRAVHAAGPNKSRILEPLLSKSYLSCLSAQLPLVLIIYNIGMWVNGRTIVIVRVWVPTLPTKDTKPSPCSKTLYAGIKISNQRVPKKNPHKKGKRWGGWKREWGQVPDCRNSDTEGEQTPGSINKKQKQKQAQQQYNSPSPAFTSKLVLWRSYENRIKKTPWSISDHYLRMLQF